MKALKHTGRSAKKALCIVLALAMTAAISACAASSTISGAGTFTEKLSSCLPFAQKNVTHVIVCGNGVNLRDAAGTSDTNVVGKLNAGDTFKLVGEEKDASGHVWYAVEYKQSAEDEEPSVGWVTSQFSVKYDDDTDAQKCVDMFSDYFGAAGVQIATIKNGALADTYVFGDAVIGKTPMSDDTKIRVASLSKVLIAMDAMAMREDGDVDLDADISEYWGKEIPKPVTLRSLLTHTSTLQNIALSTNEDTLARITDPSWYDNGNVGDGTIWMYNNYGVGVAGSTLELASGGTVEDFSQSRFFKPLGIEASLIAGNLDSSKLSGLYNPSAHGHTSARTVFEQERIKAAEGLGNNTAFFPGGLTISASDYAKLIAVLANDGTLDGVQYLKPESVALIEERQFTTDENGGSFEQCIPLRYVTGVYGQEELYYHTGNAYGTLAMASYNPKTHNGVVVVTTGAEAVRDQNGVYAICSFITDRLYAQLDK